MQSTTSWQLESTNPDNGNNLATIKQWWASLNENKVSWRQRIIPQSGDVSELNWEPLRFDEEFQLRSPEIRGITLYWRKPDEDRERSTTPRKLELDTVRQQLYVYPQSQKELVIRVGIPEIIYQKIELKNPQLQLNSVGENKILTLQDAKQQIEVKVTLSPPLLDQLRQLLS